MPHSSAAQHVAGWSPSRPRWTRRHPGLLALFVVSVIIASAWTGLLLVEQAGVGRAKSYWSAAHGNTGGLLYVALGDSAAQGVGASPPERGYVGLLATDLRTRCGCPVQVVNLSVSGARVTDVLHQQVPRLKALRPDIVTVDVGGNDVATYDPVAFSTRIDQLTAALPTGTYIADVPYFMHGRYERQAQQAAEILTRSAQARGLVTVPLHAALRARGWSAMVTDFAPDFFHPNDRGHRVWARAFWASMSGPRWPARGRLADQSFARGGGEALRRQHRTNKLRTFGPMRL